MFGIEVQRVIVTAAGCRMEEMFGKMMEKPSCNCSVFSVFTEMSPAAVSCSLLSPTSSAATQLHHTAARTRETGDYDSFSPREQNTTPPFLSCKWFKKVVGFQKESWKWALPIQQKPKIS